jgi:iron complex outermembrane receptor protein
MKLIISIILLPAIGIPAFLAGSTAFAQDAGVTDSPSDDEAPNSAPDAGAPAPSASELELLDVIPVAPEPLESLEPLEPLPAPLEPLTVARPLALRGPAPAAAELDSPPDSERHLPDVRVIGRRPEAYRQPEASAGTKIPAPLRDVPQSIQVLDRQMMDDLDVVRGTDVAKNVSGVHREGVGTDDRLVFRGFTTSEFLRDGMPDRRRMFRDTSATERVEVLKGPASVLYGRLEPGGTLNYVTKRPEPYSAASVALRTDTRGLVRPTADVSLTTDDGTLGLRVNGAYERGQTFRDYSFSDRKFGAGVFAWQPGEETRISAEVEIMDDRRRLDPGLPQFGRGPADVPVARTTNEPNDQLHVQDRLYGYRVEQSLGSSWQLRHVLRVGDNFTRDNEARAARSTTAIDGVPRNVLQETGDPRWDGIVGRQASGGTRQDDQVIGNVEAVGEASLFGTSHKVLVGVDAEWWRSSRNSFRSAIIESNGINVYDPQYGAFVAPEEREQDNFSDSTITSQGVYAQDLIKLASQWTLLMGARLDLARSGVDDFQDNTSQSVTHHQLSPRAGLVWQPRDDVSVYTSYSRSFVPVIGQTFAGELFDPTLGQQLEGGIKAEWLGGRLGATTAVFRIVKDNVSVPDPDNAGFSVQTGQTTSDGIEFDVTGSPFTGLRLIGNLTFLDARITEDTTVANIGRAPRNVPTGSGGLAMSYDLPGAGWWKGVGGRVGVYHVGERSGETNPTRPPLFLPSYTRLDAGLTYQVARLRTSLNIENVLDETYYVAINNGLIFPGAPLQGWLSVAYEL